MHLKKIIESILLSIVVILTLCMPAMASNTGGTVISSPQKVSSHIITINDQKAMESNANSVKPLSANDLTGSAGVVRVGDTTTCQVYLNWTGDMPIEGLRFKSLTVQSTSLLFKTTYGTFGDGSTYTYLFPDAAMTSGSIYVGDVQIPTDVSQVYITCSDLQVFDMASASWLAPMVISGTVTIN